MENQIDAYGNRLIQAYEYIAKAQELLNDLQATNHKIEGDFSSLLNFCVDAITAHQYKRKKHENGTSRGDC